MISGHPFVIVLAAAVALVEGVFLIGYALYIAVQVARLGITGPEAVSNPVSVIMEIVIFAGIGAGLLASAWGLWLLRRWGRAPAILGQLLALIVAVPLAFAIGSVERSIAIVAIIAAVTALICLFLPTTTRALERAD